MAKSHWIVFIVQSVKHCSANAETMGSKPVAVPILFVCLFFVLFYLFVCLLFFRVNLQFLKLHIPLGRSYLHLNLFFRCSHDLHSRYSLSWVVFLLSLQCFLGSSLAIPSSQNVLYFPLYRVPRLLGRRPFIWRLSYSIDVSLSVITDFFQIWSTLAGYERLTVGLSQSETEKNFEWMLMTLDQLWTAVALFHYEIILRKQNRSMALNLSHFQVKRFRIGTY